MVGNEPGIHAVDAEREARGWPDQVRPWRRKGGWWFIYSVTVT